MPKTNPTQAKHVQRYINLIQEKGDENIKLNQEKNKNQIQIRLKKKKLYKIKIYSSQIYNIDQNIESNRMNICKTEKRKITKGIIMGSGSYMDYSRSPLLKTRFKGRHSLRISEHPNQNSEAWSW